MKMYGYTAYEYDALGRRIETPNDAHAVELYYSKDWQVIEERNTSGGV